MREHEVTNLVIHKGGRGILILNGETYTIERGGGCVNCWHGHKKVSFIDSDDWEYEEVKQ